MSNHNDKFLKKVGILNYFSNLSKLLKSELSEALNMFGYYNLRFTKDEKRRIAEAKKTAEVFAAYNKKYGLVGRGFNNLE